MTERTDPDALDPRQLEQLRDATAAWLEHLVELDQAGDDDGVERELADVIQGLSRTTVL